MKMTANLEALIADLTPVRRVAPHDAVALVLAATGFAVMAVAMQFGLRADILAGSPDPLVVMRSGMLLILGGAALAAVVAAARPGVGQSSDGWRWALAAAALFPATGLALAVTRGALPMAELTAQSGLWCLGISGVSALMIGGVLTAWLRRGAPPSAFSWPNMAGSVPWRPKSWRRRPLWSGDTRRR